MARVLYASHSSQFWIPKSWKTIAQKQRQIGVKQLQRFMFFDYFAKNEKFQNFHFWLLRQRELLNSVNFCLHASCSACVYSVASFTAELHSVCRMHRATHSRRGRAETNWPQFKLLNFNFSKFLKWTKIIEIFEAVLLLFRTISRLWLFGSLTFLFDCSGPQPRLC